MIAAGGIMHYTIAKRSNYWIAAACVGWQLLVLFALPYLLVQNIAWALVLVPMAWLNITHWGLIHEAIHGNLNPDSETNEQGGRLLSTLFGASFHVLRFGHLMHHKLNRDWQSEYLGKGLRAKVKYYYTLLAGLYVSEVAASIGMALLPKDRFLAIARRNLAGEVVIAGERFFYQRGNIRAVRQDMAMMALIYAAAFWHYGALWPVLLGFIAIRAATISFFDNLYHYDTPADNSKAGKELALPPLVSAILLHGNYHETHHLNPKVPWHALPYAHAAQNRAFDGGLVRHGMMQFAGPLG
jgi:fatty acid desaturase